MFQVMPYLLCLDQLFSKPMFSQLILITQAMLCCRGRVTMLGLSRWSESPLKNYRRIQRFYSRSMDWLTVNWYFFYHWRFEQEEVYLLAGDETMVTKAGRQTYGLGRFFSSVHSRHVKGLGFFSLSLIGVSSRKACPLLMEQRASEMRCKVKKEVAPSSKKRSRGRPKGSGNQSHQPAELTPYLQWIQSHLKKTLSLLKGKLRLNYFLYDNAFGNQESLQMIQECGLFLISKLQCKAALWYPYQGKYSGKGAPKKYGDKVNYSDLPQSALKSTKRDKKSEIKVYQMPLRHKSFRNLLNITIIQKRRLRDGKVAQVILFSDDLNLDGETMILYYRLRFQIEFTFRDAKQFWGLEDFMNVRQQTVRNAANLSLFMVNLSRAMLETQNTPTIGSIHDLKIKAQTEFLLESLFKINPEMATLISFEKLKQDLCDIGCIHQTPRAA